MKKRIFGNTSIPVSEVGLGTWQLGGLCWGDMNKDSAFDILSNAVDQGVNFLDTADVYGQGRSEQLIGDFVKTCSEDIFVATKIGRFPTPGGMDNFSMKSFTKHTEASLNRLGVEALDLTQLHCIPTELLRNGQVFDWLRQLRQQGKIKQFGVSVESMYEALLCLDQDALCSLQIIFNVFRQKPIDMLFEKAKQKGVALIIRLPLASGLLSGKMTKDMQFSENDHRSFNRDGQLFNVGETFAGLPFEKGVELADNLKQFVPETMDMSQMAMRWILDHQAVSVVIPGASRTEQVLSNCSTSEMQPLPAQLHQTIKTFYGQKVASHIRGPY